MSDNNTFLRRLRILEYIKIKSRSGYKVTTSDILNHLNSNAHLEGWSKTQLRTVQRDMSSFESTELPIERHVTNGIPHWAWRDEKNTSLSIKDVNAALTLLLAKEYLTPLLPPDSLRFLDTYFSQAERTLYSIPEEVTRWLGVVRVAPKIFSRQKAMVDKTIIATIYKGAYKNKKIKITYSAAASSSAPKEHILDTISVINRESVVELIAITNRSGKPGRFMLHRIINAEILDQPIELPEAIDIDKTVAELLAFPGSGRMIRFKARLHRYAANQVRETPIASDQHIQEANDGEILVSGSVLDTVEFRSWIKGLGSHIEVLAPEWLRDEVLADLKKCLTCYERAAD